MCIIAVKKQGVSMPSDRIIRKMFDSNSDGCGYMVKRPEKDSVFIKKGFMNINDFMTSIKKEKIKDDDIVVMHFRIATIGGKEPRLTHPFLAVKDKSIAESLTFESKSHLCLAHNGTLSDYSLAAKSQDRSDSSMFASYIMSDKMLFDYIDSSALKTLLNAKIGSSNKLAVIKPGVHNVYLFGEWSEDGKKEYKWNEDKETGMIYSNFSWEVSSSRIYRGYSSMFIREYDSEVDESVSRETERENNRINTVSSEFENKKETELTKTLFDDDGEIKNTVSVIHIFDEVNALSKEEYDSFLDFIGMRKSEFEAKVRSGEIGLAWYIEKTSNWLDDIFESGDYRDYSTINKSDAIEYKSGVIITDSGAKNVKAAPLKTTEAEKKNLNCAIASTATSVKKV